MNGLKYLLSILCISCAGILLNAGPVPESYVVPEIEFADPDAAPAAEEPSTPQDPSCLCEDDCDCRGKELAPVAKAAPGKTWRVGDSIEVHGGTATVTKVIVEPSGKVRLAWARPRSGHWTYPGSIDSHLQAGHGVSTSGMSQEQMLSHHDSLHESTRQSLPVTRVQSGCPDGVCPTPRVNYSFRPRLLRW